MEADALKEAGVEVAVCGEGMVAAALFTEKIIRSRKPERLIMCGIAGAYNKGLSVGESVIVRSETIADLGAMRDGVFKPLFVSTYHCPLPAIEVGFRTATSNSVNVSGLLDGGADIENMEGAGFFAACMERGAGFIELRTISNYVSDKRDDWNIPLALRNMRRDLKILVDALGNYPNG